MLVTKLLLGRINWYEWVFAAALVGLVVTVVIQNYRLEISKLELEKSQLLQKETAAERDFIIASKGIDDKITNKALNEIEQINSLHSKEKEAFHEQYTKVVQNTEKPSDSSSSVPPNPPVINETESKQLESGDVIPKDVRRVSAKETTEKKKVETKPIEKKKTVIPQEPKEPQAKLTLSESERARVKLISNRLHNAWSCSQGTVSGCTT